MVPFDFRVGINLVLCTASCDIPILTREIRVHDTGRRTAHHSCPLSNFPDKKYE